MAGTPTQYYGFPTYADSDAVDLTAQYNTAVINIDSELHQIDTRVNSLESDTTIIACGDSWTDVDGHPGYFSWLDIIPESVTVHKYAVWGSTIPSIVEQVKTAAAEHPYTGREYIIVVGGVNSYASLGDNPHNEIWTQIVDAFNSAYSHGYPPDRVQWFLNDGKRSFLADPTIISKIVSTAKIYGYPIHSCALFFMLSNMDNAPYLGDGLHPTGNGSINVYAAIMETVFGYGLENTASSAVGSPTVKADIHVNGDSFRVTFAGLTSATLANPPVNAVDALAQYATYGTGAGVSGDTLTVSVPMGYIHN